MAVKSQHSFAGGILSPSFWGRSDHPMYDKGLKDAVNVLVTQHGSLMKRPGFDRHADIPSGARIFPIGRYGGGYVGVVCEDGVEVLDMGDGHVVQFLPWPGIENVGRYMFIRAGARITDAAVATGAIEELNRPSRVIVDLEEGVLEAPLYLLRTPDLKPRATGSEDEYLRCVGLDTTAWLGHDEGDDWAVHSVWDVPAPFLYLAKGHPVPSSRDVDRLAELVHRMSSAHGTSRAACMEYVVSLAEDGALAAPMSLVLGADGSPVETRSARTWSSSGWRYPDADMEGRGFDGLTGGASVDESDVWPPPGGDPEPSTLLEGIEAFFSCADGAEAIDIVQEIEWTMAGTTAEGKVGKGFVEPRYSTTSGLYHTNDGIYNRANGTGDAKTYAAWVKLTERSANVSNCIVTSRWGNERYSGIAVCQAGFGINYKDGNYDRCIDEYLTTIPLNEWHHYAITYSGGNPCTIRYYMDGELVKEYSKNTSGYYLNYFVIARHSNASSTNADGIVDEVGIWDRELTAEEVQKLYAAGNAGVSYPFAGY